MTRRSSYAVAGTVAAALALTLSACTGPTFSAGEQGFVSGDGTVTVLDPADRKPPRGPVEGETVDGEPVSLEDHRGKVVVVPV